MMNNAIDFISCIKMSETKNKKGLFCPYIVSILEYYNILIGLATELKQTAVQLIFILDEHFTRFTSLCRTNNTSLFKLIH